MDSIQAKLSNSKEDFSIEDLLQNNELTDEKDLKKTEILNKFLKNLDKSIEENDENKINQILDKINQFIKNY
ncbi:MAG: hypothetical protein ACP5RD_03335 [bacterium]